MLKTADLSGQQITDARLCLVKESDRLSPGPTAFLNVVAKIEQQVGSIFRLVASCSSNPKSSNTLSLRRVTFMVSCVVALCLALLVFTLRNGRFVARR